jgi:hypothetical protein
MANLMCPVHARPELHRDYQRIGFAGKMLKVHPLARPMALDYRRRAGRTHQPTSAGAFEQH